LQYSKRWGGESPEVFEEGLVSTDRLSEYLAQFSQARQQLVEHLRRIIVGQAEVVEQILAAVFTRGHCLLVGVPGLAKTLMVSSIAQILDVSFKRVQFTPDLMPTDITGTMVLDEAAGRRDFRFVKGPIFANIVLAAKAIVNLQKLVRSVPAGDYVKEYAVRLTRATRPKDPLAPDFVKRMVDWGAGPRAGINLVQGAKAVAAMDGRYSVAIDDIKKIAVPVLRHRISTNFQAQAEGQTTDTLIQRLVAEIREPDVPKYDKRS